MVFSPRRVDKSRFCTDHRSQSIAARGETKRAPKIRTGPAWEERYRRCVVDRAAAGIQVAVEDFAESTVAANRNDAPDPAEQGFAGYLSCLPRTPRHVFGEFNAVPK